MPEDVTRARKWLELQFRAPEDARAPFDVQTFEPLVDPDDVYFCNILAFQNGWVHVQNPEILHPYNGDFFIPNPLDYEYDPQATVPKPIDTALARWWDIDDQYAAELAYFQLIGYLASRSVALQKCYMFHGGSGTGKTLAVNILRWLFAGDGDYHVGEVRNSNLSSQFGMYPFVDKLFVVIDDSSGTGKDKPSRISWSDTVMSLVGTFDGRMAVEKKYIDQFQVDIFARLVWTANNPIWCDINPDGWNRRIIYFKYANTLGENTDSSFHTTLRKHRAALMVRGLYAWRDLVRNAIEDGQDVMHAMIEPQASIDLRASYFADRNLISEWLRRTCTVTGDPEHFETTKDLHRDFNDDRGESRTTWEQRIRQAADRRSIQVAGCITASNG